MTDPHPERLQGTASQTGHEPHAGNARETILEGIRRALGRESSSPAAKAVEQRLGRHEVHVQPDVEGDPIAHFATRAKASAATLARAASPAEAVAAIEKYLAELGLEGVTAAAAPEPWLQGLPWRRAAKLEFRATRGDDAVVVTSAYAGVAETGSLVMLSGPEHPTGLNFLPDVHVVVLPADRIVRHLEDVWVRLRAEHSTPPRTVNLITGPSRTADIEQTIQLGAHGPRRLHIVLLRTKSRKRGGGSPGAGPQRRNPGSS
jgi:L-lactate dehydrogenase complex protein LldG